MPALDVKKEIYRLEQFREAVHWMATQPHVRSVYSLRMEAKRRLEHLERQLADLRALLPV